MRTDWVGVVIEGEFGGLQAKLVGLVVEGIVLVGLTVGGVAGAVVVVTEVAVDVAA